MTRNPTRGRNTALLLPLHLSLLLPLYLGSAGCRQRVPGRSFQRDARASAPPTALLYPSGPGSFVQLIEQLKGAVLHLSGKSPARHGVARWFPTSASAEGELLGELQHKALLSLGTGTLIDDQGSILTTAQIAAQGQEILVDLPGGARVPATLAGHDLRTNVALLKITPPHEESLRPARLGDSQELRVGERVAALGNPFGLGITASAGVIHAREAPDLPADQIGLWGMLQTDAAIHPGNAGGPLINAFGEVVGINVATDQETRGIGFAIPLSLVKRLLPQLQRTGRVVRTYLGSYIKPVSEEIAAVAGLTPARGAYVDAVVPGGPAERAGLRAGDIILSFDGQEIPKAAALRQMADLAGVGREVPITVWRDGETLHFGLTPEPKPD